MKTIFNILLLTIFLSSCLEEKGVDYASHKYDGLFKLTYTKHTASYDTSENRRNHEFGIQLINLSSGSSVFYTGNYKASPFTFVLSGKENTCIIYHHSCAFPSEEDSVRFKPYDTIVFLYVFEEIISPKKENPGSYDSLKYGDSIIIKEGESIIVDGRKPVRKKDRYGE